MRVLSLHQPWASLCVTRVNGEVVKRIETRSWSTSYRGRLLIHASKRRFGLGSDTAEFIRSWPLSVYQALPRPHADAEMCDNYPLGAIVGSVDLVEVVPTLDTDYDIWPPEHRSADVAWDADGSGWSNAIHLAGGGQPTKRYENQRPYGDFGPGRFAWIFGDAKATTERCPTCWGRTFNCAPDGHVMSLRCTCPTCDGKGVCEPIPARGRQGLWEWTA